MMMMIMLIPNSLKFPNRVMFGLHAIMLKIDAENKRRAKREEQRVYRKRIIIQGDYHRSVFNKMNDDKIILIAEKGKWKKSEMMNKWDLNVFKKNTRFSDEQTAVNRKTK